MKREVAELSGNFRGELFPPDGSEGIRLIFALCVNVGNAEARVRKQEKHCTRWNQGILNPLYEHSVNSTKIIQEDNNERITKNQN